MKLLILVVALAVSASAEDFYKGYKLYDVKANTSMQEMALRAIGTSGEFDFWGTSRVLVKPEQIARFENLMSTSGISFDVAVDDVDEMARKEKAENRLALSRSAGDRLSFTAYHRYDVMLKYLDQIASQNPNIAKVETIGTSYEGRPIKALRLSTGGNGQKPAVVLDAGIHAREWLAPTTALYLIEQLVSSQSSLLTKLDWIIIPLLNPDGYEYSHDRERFWRKTRSKTSGSSCLGVDGNRNFDFHWMEVGASSSPCSETFAGKIPFSEPETSALRDLLLKTNVKLYLTIHTYGQYFLYPWGWTSALPDNWRDLDALGRKAASAIQGVIGTRYTVGSSTNVLYAAAGGSDDYALAVGKAPFSYTIELPAGGSGFDPPPSSILPVCQETMAAFVTTAKHVADLYG